MSGTHTESFSRKKVRPVPLRRTAKHWQMRILPLQRKHVPSTPRGVLEKTTLIPDMLASGGSDRVRSSLPCSLVDLGANGINGRKPHELASSRQGARANQSKTRKSETDGGLPRS